MRKAKAAAEKKAKAAMIKKETGEDVPEEEDEEEDDEKAADEKKEEDDPEALEEEEEEEGAEEEEEELEPPEVELTTEERNMVFCKTGTPDLTNYVLNMSFTSFSVPDKDEPFDEIRYEWLKGVKCTEYVKQWVLDRKLTTRVEDITPSEWFIGKWKEWQKVIQVWHLKHNEYKNAMTKKAADRNAKIAQRAQKKAAAEKLAALKAESEERGESEKEGVEEEPEDQDMDLEEEDEEEEKIDFDKVDVFGVEDVLDLGGGEPLFCKFGFEDWTLMTLRHELHLLAHGFRRDCKDPDRLGIHLDHLAFYYHKYFKKTLSTKFFGVESSKEVIDLVRDCVVVNPKNQVVEAQLPDDMESHGIFVMLTEESRRDRQRRIDLGDESAVLKLTQPQYAQTAQRSQAGSVRPYQAGAIQAGAAVRPQPWYNQRPQFAGMYRPGVSYGAARPYAAWRPTWG